MWGDCLRLHHARGHCPRHQRKEHVRRHLIQKSAPGFFQENILSTRYKVDYYCIEHSVAFAFQSIFNPVWLYFSERKSVSRLLGSFKGLGHETKQNFLGPSIINRYLLSLNSLMVLKIVWCLVVEQSRWNLLILNILSSTFTDILQLRFWYWKCIPDAVCDPVK